MRSVSKKLRLMFVLQCSGFVSEPAVFVYLIVFICVHQGPSSDIPENIDYDFAQQELMLQQMEDDPIQVAIRSIEKQHEEDKQGKFFCSYWCHGFIKLVRLQEVAIYQHTTADSPKRRCSCSKL